ncbi:MAG: PEP-CTERM sorting domain-containing protein [Planctomycetales bacterium]|nr:PEP-CTERM sorting domain-containing protein [Planctomycetales bacterium]
MTIKRFCRLVAVGILASAASFSYCSAREVVAFWGFADDYDFDTNPKFQDFAADVDATVAGNANLQAFRGDPDDLDDNGGNGFVTYTSPVSGLSYDLTRTVKFDDLSGGGDDFSIGGTSSFLIDKQDGNGPQSDDFGNDALVYLTLDGTGYRDFDLRFDIEGATDTLPTTFDIFYRVAGSDVWYRDAAQNNIPLFFMDLPTPEAGVQYADSGVISLSAALDNSSAIELIVSDFKENGNGEMELDNIEITASRVPEPTAGALLALAALGLTSLRRRRG